MSYRLQIASVDESLDLVFAAALAQQSGVTVNIETKPEHKNANLVKDGQPVATDRKSILLTLFDLAGNLGVDTSASKDAISAGIDASHEFLKKETLPQNLDTLEANLSTNPFVAPGTTTLTAADAGVWGLLTTNKRWPILSKGGAHKAKWPKVDAWLGVFAPTAPSSPLLGLSADVQQKVTVRLYTFLHFLAILF